MARIISDKCKCKKCKTEFLWVWPLSENGETVFWKGENRGTNCSDCCLLPAGKYLTTVCCPNCGAEEDIEV